MSLISTGSISLDSTFNYMGESALRFNDITEARL